MLNIKERLEEKADKITLLISGMGSGFYVGLGIDSLLTYHQKIDYLKDIYLETLSSNKLINLDNIDKVISGINNITKDCNKSDLVFALMDFTVVGFLIMAGILSYYRK